MHWLGGRDGRLLPTQVDGSDGGVGGVTDEVSDERFMAGILARLKRSRKLTGRWCRRKSKLSLPPSQPVRRSRLLSQIPCALHLLSPDDERQAEHRTRSEVATCRKAARHVTCHRHAQRLASTAARQLAFGSPVGISPTPPALESLR